jgi:hypothetical protein
MRIEDPSGQTVEVRIGHRSGELNVDVRTGSSTLSQDLRQSLGDLESRLSQNGYRADATHATHTEIRSESGTSTRSSSSSERDPSQQESAFSQQNRGRRDQNPSGRQRPRAEFVVTPLSSQDQKGNQDGLGS